MPFAEPYTNDIYNTEGGYSAQTPRKNPARFDVTIQVVDPLTLHKLDKIQEAIAFGYRVQFACLEGYLNYNNGTNDLQNVIYPMDSCTLDVQELSGRGIKLGRGIEWKRNVKISVRESATLVRPTSGDVVTVGGGGN